MIRAVAHRMQEGAHGGLGKSCRRQLQRLAETLREGGSLEGMQTRSFKIGNATLRLSGYALSEDSEELDLFVTLYSGEDGILPVADSDTKNAADQCLRFRKKRMRVSINLCAAGWCNWPPISTRTESSGQPRRQRSSPEPSLSGNGRAGSMRS